MVNAVMNLNINVTGARAQRVIQQHARSVDMVSRSYNRATVAAGRMNMAMRLRNLDQFGKNIQWIGRQIEFNFTLPLMIAGGFATKWALDNERAMTRVAKVYNDFEGNALSAEQELEKLATTFRLLSDLMGVHQDEVIEIGAMYAQAGANAGNLGVATKMTMETMILGGMEAEESTRALIAIQQQYDLALTDTSSTVVSLSDVLAGLNAIENATAVSFEGLVQAMARSGGIAREAGVDYRHLGAMIASLVPAAGTATEAGNSLRTMIARVMRPTRQTADALSYLVDEYGTASWASQNFVERLFTIEEAMQGISDSQRVAVADMVAGKRQGNRFLILLRDIVAEEGKYATALEVTNSQLETQAAWQDELRTYLESTPQGFAILTTQIRNLMTEAIQPLLPMMINALTVIRDMMRSFMELSDSQKTAIFYFGVFLVLIGPAMRIFGATIMLLASVAGGFYALGRAILFILTPFRLIATAFMALPVLIAKAFTGIFVFLGAALPRIFAFAAGMTRAFFGFFTAVVVGFQRFYIALWTIMGKGIAGLITMSVTVTKVSRAFLALAWGTIAIVSNMFVGLGRVFTQGLAALGALLSKAVPLLLNPWTWLVIAVIGVFVVFYEEIREFISSLISLFWDLPEGVVGALRAMVNVVKQAAMAVYEWLSWMNPFARHSPSLVEQVRAGVDVIAGEYARLSNIGTIFRRAAADMREFMRATEDARRSFQSAELAELREEVLAAEPGAGNAFDNVVRGIRDLEGVLKRVQVQYDAQVLVVEKWERALADVNQELELQEMILRQLEDAASSIQQELSDAEARLNTLMQTPIQGMGAMSDAIFENEMAQKRLRLEILRMEEVDDTIEDVRSRMADLSGDIDMLNANREDLRLAGAGSDVLGKIDSQIAMLEAERRALNGAEQATEGGMSDLEKQLAELEKQGEILRLEESLKFDPMLRELDKLTNGMNELPFEQLKSQIIAEQANIERLTAEYEAATAAVDAQKQVVDSVIQQRDAVQDRYDAELDKLNELSTAYSSIEQQINDMRSALDDFAQAAETAKAAGGAGAGAGAGGDPLGPAGDFDIPGGSAGGGSGLTGGDIDALNEELARDLEGLFEFDLWAMLREEWDKFIGWLRGKWDEFVGWLEEHGIDLDAIIGGIREAWDELVAGITRKWEEITDGISLDSIGEKLDELGRMFAPVWTAVQEAWDLLVQFFRDLGSEIAENIDMDTVRSTLSVLAGYFTFTIGLIIGAFTLLWPPIRNVLSAVLTWVTEIIGAILRIFSGVIDFLQGVFTGDWEQAWEGIKDIFGGIWDAIVASFELVWDVLTGLVEGLVEGIRDFFTWLYNVLVGNSIIPDMVNAIIGWFVDLKELVLAPVRFLRDKMIEIWNFIKTQSISIFTTVKNFITEKFTQVRNNVRDRLNNVRDKFKEVLGWTRTYVLNPVRIMKNTLSGLWDGIKSKVRTVWNAIAGILNRTISGIESMLRALVSAWNSLPFNGPDIKVKFDIPRVPTASGDRTGGSESRGGSSSSSTDMSRVPAGIPDLHTGGIAIFGAAGEGLALLQSRERVLSVRQTMAFERLVANMESGTVGRKNVVIQINGNLEFPNISDGGDAEEFIRNLEAMVD